MLEMTLMAIPYVCTLGVGILIGLGLGADRRKG